MAFSFPTAASGKSGRQFEVFVDRLSTKQGTGVSVTKL
jgi:hypothetical protein